MFAHVSHDAVIEGWRWVTYRHGEQVCEGRVLLAHSGGGGQVRGEGLEKGGEEVGRGWVEQTSPPSHCAYNANPSH